MPILCYAFALFFSVDFQLVRKYLKKNEKYFEKSLQLSK